MLSGIRRLTGLLWLINLSSETFSAYTGVGSTAPFLLGGFFLWGLGGYLCANRSKSFTSGIIGAVWAAMLTVLLTVTLGFMLGFIARGRLEYLIQDDP